MKFKIEYIKDVLGNNYLGIKIPNFLVDKYLKDLKYYLEDDNKYDLLVKNQKNRDNDKYHITVINVWDFNALTTTVGMQQKIDTLMQFDISDIQFMGIGEAKSYISEAYFIVCKSKILNDILKNLGLPEKDFHITIGFNPKDVFDKPKNQVIKLKSPFEKTIAKKLAQYDGKYTFVFDISNFDDVYNDEKNLNIISMTDSLLTLSVRDMKFQIGLVDDELKVLTESILKNGK